MSQVIKDLGPLIDEKIVEAGQYCLENEDAYIRSPVDH